MTPFKFFVLKADSTPCAPVSLRRPTARSAEVCPARSAEVCPSGGEELEAGVTSKELTGMVKQARGWQKRGDVFIYFTAGSLQAPNCATRLPLRR